MSYDKQSIESLRKAFERRWGRLVKKTRKINRLDLPDKGKVWNKVKESWTNGFKCEYCGKKMLIKDSQYPYERSFSLDHKTSINLGGDNSIENFAIVCHQCNIIKGTLCAETYKRLLKEDEALLKNRQFLNRVFSEMWNGKLASKLDRERARS